MDDIIIYQNMDPWELKRAAKAFEALLELPLGTELEKVIENELSLVEQVWEERENNIQKLY